jgi:Zn-finger domain-containing protein
MEDKEKPDLTQMPSYALIEHVSQRLDQHPSVDDLKEMKKEMVKRGFVNPFAHLGGMPGKIDTKEAEDIKKHIDYFMKIAIMKKYSLVRAQAMIASEALKKTLGRSGYSDLTDYLPDNGDYIGMLIESGSGAVKAYRELDSLFSNTGHWEKRHFAEVEEFGVVYRIRGKSREMLDLPENAKIRKTGTYKKRFPIIKSKIIRKIVCTAVSSYVSELAIEQFNKGKMKEYNDALKELGIAPFSRMDHIEEMENEKRSLVKKGYMETDGEKFWTKKEVSEEVFKTKDAMNKWIMKNAVAMLFAPIMKYYLFNSKSEREKLAMFPTLAANPTDEQLAIFANLRKLMDIDAYSIVKRKLQFEDVMESRTLAAGLLSIYGKRDIAMKMTGMDEKLVEKAESEVKMAMESGKGKEFTRHLGD